MEKYCYECGKKISFWESRFHPVLGKKERVCSDCFSIVEESLENYRNFILNNLDHGHLRKETDYINNKINLAKY